VDARPDRGRGVPSQVIKEEVGGQRRREGTPILKIVVEEDLASGPDERGRDSARRPTAAREADAAGMSARVPLSRTSRGVG